MYTRKVTLILNIKLQPIMVCGSVKGATKMLRKLERNPNDPEGPYRMQTFVVVETWEL